MPPLCENQSVRPRGKYWLETEAGAYLMGPRTYRLLKALEATESLKAAARAAGFSYRAAWDRLRAVEGALGMPLVQSQSGGKRGGHTRLTPEGRAFLMRYERFLALAEKGLEQAFKTAFGD